MMERKNLRMCLRAAYKIQNLRVKLWLQILAKLKMDNPEVEDEIKAKITTPRKLERVLLKEYNSFEEINVEGYAGKRYIRDDLFFIMVQAHFNLHQQEERMFKVIGKLISDHPLFEYIKTIHGCDEATTAILLSEIEISKSKYISSLYLLSGLDCGPDNKARNRSAAHLIDRTYIDKDGKEKTKKSITYNPFLHDKILGTIGPNLIRAKSMPYYKTYDDYKHRLEMRPDWKDKTKMHRHRAAIRYMMRTFMANLYRAWRPMEGLDVFESYEFEKLHLDHWGAREMKSEQLLEASA